MNNMMLELAKQAGFDTEQYDPEADLDGLPMGFLEDYGNLIIRECAKIANKEQTWNDTHDIKVNIDQCILCHFELA
jgi:hypothetical protein